jgi:hypothetical protein
MRVSRILTLAHHTVTQLLRMKILAFLGVFAVLVVAVAFAFPVLNPEQQLKLLKDVSFGALQLFAVVIAITATALLIPKDVEDRTLYTILAKPVPRLDYLLGKLLGVLALIGGGLLIMDGLFTAVLYWKEQAVIAETAAGLQSNGAASGEVIQQTLDAIRKQGVSWTMHIGVWAIFLKASVLAALALLISCFASSTLFTIISTFCFAVVGHGQGLFREHFFKGGSDTADYALSTAMSVACPDLTLYDVVDSAIDGTAAIGTAVSTMTGMSLLYIVGYVVVAYLIFVEKEL